MIHTKRDSSTVQHCSLIQRGRAGRLGDGQSWGSLVQKSELILIFQLNARWLLLSEVKPPVAEKFLARIYCVHTYNSSSAGLSNRALYKCTTVNLARTMLVYIKLTSSFSCAFSVSPFCPHSNRFCTQRQYISRANCTHVEKVICYQLELRK